jgi:hypothetical protein
MPVPARNAVVIPFPAPSRPVGNRLSVRDRIEALRWAETARAAGYTRVVLDTSAEQLAPELGDFLLAYRGDANWASWGVGCVEDEFMLWRPATGATVGRFSTLRAALDKILALS